MINRLRYIGGTSILTTSSSPVITPSADLQGMQGFSVQYLQTGTGEGVIKLQASNDNTNFTDISGAQLTITDTDMAIIEYVDPQFRYVRAVVTPDASLTMDVQIIRKGI